MKTAIVLVIAVLAQAAGNTYLSKGMKELAASTAHGDQSLLWMGLQVLGSPVICFGTLLLIVFFLLFSAALSWEDLSFVLPATSLGYVLNLAFAHHFLNEAVSPTRWFGTALISLGVLLVAKSGSRSVQEALGTTSRVGQ
jgi:drug/metabolite transporter (DMT)-like permease